MKKDDHVLHSQFGIGKVILDNGETVIVRFSHGIEECESGVLEEIILTRQALRRAEWDIPLEVINRTQAWVIQSVNDVWGVFSPCRIELLPHQLWVCRQVIQNWPARWLVADDVGLGKTVEAGMILGPLLSRGTVKRLLILCPAALVEQWQYRLRTMFDIRLARYTPEADTPRSDFWGMHRQIVASLQTLRMDNEIRQKRLIESEPWDLLIVDEAHHLNTDEQHGLTLGYKLVRKLQEEGRVKSMVFFTGTPHRGKDFAFISLLQLLRPDLFDPRKALSQQLDSLKQVMIRNNKSSVTDLRGNRLFYEPKVSSETYRYSAAEEAFYQMLTQFILTGRAYASTLSQTEGRAVMLVLITMQKLASSSVAAIQRAISARLSRIQAGHQRMRELKDRIARYQEAEKDILSDELSKVEEEFLAYTSALKLMEGEEATLRALLAAAEEVRQETKIGKIINVVQNRFSGRSVLFFTEYKATQSLLMGALMKQFGEDSVTFINGDNRAEGVCLPDNRIVDLDEIRDVASEKFNSGKTRFLVSTEAAGEGIDLQEQCHSLIHVDLPWNPMRLHQRVGRLNRYGQSMQVEVLTLRNPDTVESRIWEKLNEKIQQINLALGQVMDEPEDMLQLVLGMTSPSFFRELFSAPDLSARESLGSWFDQKTASFGGRDAIQTVIDIVGNASKFDFREVSPRLPQADLPDLRVFIEIALSLNGRRPRDDSEGFSFITPEPWRANPAVRSEYRGMKFDRNERSASAARSLMGVGHAAMDQAIHQAKRRTASIAALSSDILATPLIVFLLRDRVTEGAAGERAMVVGVDPNGKSGAAELLLDWQILRQLNGLPWRRTFMARSSPNPGVPDEIETRLSEAEEFVRKNLDQIDHEFRHPDIELLSLFWPMTAGQSDLSFS